MTSDNVILATAAVAGWGPVAIAWTAARQVSRRSGVPWIQVLADRRSWESERILGLRSGRLAVAWLAVGTALWFVVGFWRP